MTNAIEQTRREMYGFFNSMKGRIMINYSVKDIADGINEFESALEAHLEELRKDRQFCESVVELSEAKAAKAIEERDTLRNKLQALQMASSTAAEVIRGLRSELEEARDNSRDDQLIAANSLIQRQRIEIANLYMRNVESVQVQCAHSFHHIHEHCIYCGVRK